MPDNTSQSENHTRIFRDNSFAWYDKEVMRYLREKYGKDKKKFLIIRAVYTALTEVESDFKTTPINFFTKTVGTYAGVSREVAGKYLNILEEEGLITKTRERDPKTRKFLPGTTIRILSLKSIENPQEEKPVSGYPSNGLPQRWDTQASNKNISSFSEIKINVNENFKNSDNKKRYGMQGINDILKRIDILKQQTQKQKPKKERPEEILKRDALAQDIAETLEDQNSLGAFRKIAEVVPESIIRDYLSNIKESWKEGKIKKSRGALFMHMILQYCESKQLPLGFKTGATP